MKTRRPPEECPVCEADVPPTAKACPECGACYASGWRDDDGDDAPEEIDYELLDLPDEVLDDEDRRAIAAKRMQKGIPRRWRWIALGLVVMWLVAFWLYRGALLPW